jgi:hypothetical protein
MESNFSFNLCSSSNIFDDAVDFEQLAIIEGGTRDPPSQNEVDSNLREYLECRTNFGNLLLRPIAEYVFIQFDIYCTVECPISYLQLLLALITVSFVRL